MVVNCRDAASEEGRVPELIADDVAPWAAPPKQRTTNSGLTATKGKAR